VGYTYRFNLPAVIEALKQEEPVEEQEGQITEQLELDFNEEQDL
jgi:hypothetical protein